MAIKTRKNNRFFKNVKNSQKSSNKLMDMIMRTAMAVGFVMAPWAMEEAGAEIVRDDNGKTVTNGNVHNIYAGQVSGDNAVNRFSKFNLESGQIANMYFRQNMQGADAKNLFNFVNDKINIAGTVNAIKGNKIGGNMYFLSPNGMVVSGTGVINAGSLTVMAGGKYPGSNDKALEFAKDITAGKYGITEEDQGSISIAGRINTTDGISLVSSKEVIIGSGANLGAFKKVDFKDLVNLKDSSGKVIVDSGLNTANLVLERSDDATGNIMLAARSVSANANEDKEKLSGIDCAGNNTYYAKVEVQKDSSIKSDEGTVSIGAYATRDKTNTVGNLTTFGDAGIAHAEISIDGSIEGKKVAINSSASNVYKSSLWEQLLGVVKSTAIAEIEKKIGNIGSIDLAFIALNGQATVDINGNAKIKATDGTDATKTNAQGEEYIVHALQVNATSKINTKGGASTSSAGVNNDNTNPNLIGANSVYTYLDNTAKINVASGASLEAVKGGVGLVADADTQAFTTSKTNTNGKAEASDKLAVALALNLGQTSAEVNVAEKSKVAGNAIEVGSTSGIDYFSMT